MTIDERLERLTERHEALAQSVETLTLDVGNLAKRVDNLVQISERHEREWQRLRRSLRAALETWLEDDGEDEEPESK